MPAGLFELRKDPITGWWVATIVDRAFHRDRFARVAEPVDDLLGSSPGWPPASPWFCCSVCITDSFPTLSSLRD